MSKMDNKRVIFAAVISDSKEPDSESEWKVNTLNNGVPLEAVIMQLKALIKNYENNYFDSFDNKLTK